MFRRAKEAVAAWLPVVFAIDRQERSVNVIGSLCVVYVVLFDVIFSSAAPWFAGAGRLGSLVSDVAIGYIAAWIFLYLVAWRPTYLERQLAAKVVARHTFRLFANATQIKGMLRVATRSVATGPLTKSELTNLCATVTCRQPSNSVLLLAPSVPVSVIWALWNKLDDNSRTTPRIVELMASFDSDFVLRVAQLQGSDLVALVWPMVDIEQVISPALMLGHMEPALRAYLNQCDELWGWICINYPHAATSVVPMAISDRMTPQFQLD